jgi:predicted regulator of Ras-like GTPase activity (Roadblock/LC7/MglB family)
LDATAAIAELRVAGRDGSVIASSVRDEPAERIAQAAQALADGADQVRSDLGRDALAQLQAATPEGSVFVVVDGGTMAVATTGTDPTVGLVFYDLKTLLRQIDGAPEGDAAA